MTCKTFLSSLSSSIFSLGGGVYYVELLVLKKFMFDENVFFLSITEAQVGLLLCFSCDRDNKIN